MKVLNNTTKSGTSALDAAVKSISKFSSWSSVLNTMVQDCAKYGGTTFLKKMCGINLSNSDTGAITGSDAGGGSTKTATSIVPESGSWKYPSKTSFTIQGLKVTVPKKSSLDSSQQYIVGALYTWWIKNSLSLIKKSYGLSFTDKNASVKEISIGFFNSSNGVVAYTDFDDDQKASYLKLRINMRYFSGIEKKRNSNGVGTSETICYLDRTIAHELAHAAMAANIDYFYKMPTIFKEGSAELVHGIDDKRKSNIQEIVSSSSNLRSAIYGSGANNYAAGYVALRYLAKQAAANRNPSSSKNISSDYYAENNFSETTAADEILQSDNFTTNNSSLDEIVSAKDFSVAEFADNTLLQNQNNFEVAYSAQKNDAI